MIGTGRRFFKITEGDIQVINQNKILKNLMDSLNSLMIYKNAQKLKDLQMTALDKLNLEICYKTKYNIYIIIFFSYYFL